MAKQKEDKRRQQKRDSERRRREKIKKNPELYEEAKERERQRYHKRKNDGKIKLIAEVSARSKRNIRRRWKNSSSKYRSMLKTKSKLVGFLENNTPPDSPASIANELSDNENNSNTATPSTSRKQCGRKRILRNKSKTYRELKKLKEKLKNAEKKVSKYKSKYYRRKNDTSNKNEDSPRTKVKGMLKGQIVTPSVKKKLLFAEALTSQLSANFKEKQTVKDKQDFVKSITGPIVKRCRVLNQIDRSFGTYKLLRVKKNKKHRKTAMTNKIKKIVEEFYERDECSRLAPGKKDTVTFKKCKKQKRFLNRSIKKLYHNFCNQKDRITISYSLFCQFRPFWVLVPNAALRETCLCVTHENMRLLVIKMKLLGLINQNHPDDLCKTLCCGSDNKSESCFERNCELCKGMHVKYNTFNGEEQTTYKKWQIKKETINIKGKDKVCQKHVKEVIQCTKRDLTVILEKMLPGYMQHITNVKHQYEATDLIKKTLDSEDVLIHMDFSENYNCKYFREIQSAHFGGSKPQVTLHTVVWYRKSTNGEVVATSFCSLSTCLRHDPTAIVAHLQPLITQIKNLIPTLKRIHFLSDGPTTQYRNKIMFYLFGTHLPSIAQTTEMTWNYSESGHGKGAPDGVGGCLKRTADRLVANGEDIPNLEVLFSKLQKACPGIALQIIDEGSVTQLDKLTLGNGTIKPFKGTMKAHQLAWHIESKNKLQVRRLSCTHCAPYFNCKHYHLGEIDLCLTEAKNKHSRLQYRDIYSDSESDNDASKGDPTPIQQLANPVSLNIGKFILVEWPEDSLVFYVGQIENIKPNSNIQVNFMQRIFSKKNDYVFIWPEEEDHDTVSCSTVKTILSNPKSLRRNKFCFPDTECKIVQNIK